MSLPSLARPELVGDFGMVSSTHWLASQTAMGVLERGGNAFDAVAAGAFVLQVVEPHLNGPGGDAPILGWDATTREPFVLCGQGPAPARASIERFVDLGLDQIPGTGYLAACVPGAFGAWLTLARDRGTLSVREILETAAHYAEHGFVCLPKISTTIAAVREHLSANWPSSAALWLSHGAAPGPGSILRNQDLARTLGRIIAEAETGGSRDQQFDVALDAFYRGFVAEAISDFVTTPVVDGSGRAHRALLSADDLAGWRATYERPLSYDYHGETVLKPEAWSQGPVLLQQLALLAGWDLSSLEPGSAEFVHLVTECAKLAFADREAHYGDPLFTGIDTAALLDEAYSAERRALVAETADLGALRPGAPAGRRGVLPPEPVGSPVLMPGMGEPTFGRVDEGRGDTCHIDVVDRWGNTVAATPSGGWLQSSPTIPGLGLALGTRAQMFWLDPGHPNALAPGKRPRTTLSPTMTLRGGDPHLAFGTPGGDSQDQCSLVFLLRHLHHGMNLQEAIEAPAFYSEHFHSSFYPRRRHPGRLRVEDRLDPGAVAELERRGHEVHREDPWSIGRLSAVSRDAEGILRAGANPRGAQSYAVGR